jgi:hypothetical protein
MLKTYLCEGFDVFTAVVLKSIIFWDMTPCSPLWFNRRFGGTSREQAACHLLARWFAEPISSTLKMEAIGSSETSIETQRTTRRYLCEIQFKRAYYPSIYV